MKTKTVMALLLAWAWAANATLFSSGTLNAVIPDNSPNGYASTIAVSGLESLLSSVTVQLNVSGGYNGDLVAYLEYNGQLVTLLNRVGTGGGNANGYADTGFNITLSDSGTAGLHNYQSNGGTVNGNGQLTGTWQPDSGGVTFATAYDNVNPNGTWDLFFADLSQGDQSTLVSWSLDITAVPEPVGLALGMFAGLMGLRWWLGRYWTRTGIKEGPLHTK